MTQTNYASIARDGLWNNNPGLVQILGLCPLMAVSNSTVNGLGLGLATMLTLVVVPTLYSLSDSFVALFRKREKIAYEPASREALVK